ncbi:MAG: 5-(carboxyamino)imidazole ribonucleotide mutase [Bacteroidetes bacterium]|nr:5-(carboxyamino)imidazole ribonucleotide mutase [Bacteroidota bacterium]
METEQHPLIGIVMGSESDWPIMEGGARILKEFGIRFETRVLSAHRTPDTAKTYAEEAHTRGIKVLIAGAGMAAHLAGVLAGCSPLPVIGVPIASGALQGIDALLATVQMPSGVPVATVAIGGSKNAAILAIQILATGDNDLRKKLAAYKKEMVGKVQSMDARVQELASQL